MSVVFTESFDNLAQNDGLTYHKWVEATRFTSGAGGGASASATLITGRLGSGHACNFASSGGTQSVGGSFNTYDLKSNLSTVFVTCGFRENGSTAGMILMWLYDSNFTTQNLDLRWAAGNVIQVTRNGTVLCTSSILNTATWYVLEIGALISTTVGWAELRINGVLNASYYGASGTSRGTANGNTQATAIASVRFMRHGNNSGNNQSSNRDFDDIVVCSSAGAVNNDFVGNVNVVGLLPNAVGTTSGLTRTGGTVSGNYTAVGDNPIDGDTSYVASSVVSTYDTYNYPSLPGTSSSVLAVVANPVSRLDDAGSRTLTTRVRSPGGSEADYAGAASNLSSSYNTFQHIMEVSPVTTVAWTVNDVNNGEFGPKVAA